MKRWAILGIILVFTACANLNLAQERARYRLSELRVGESSKADVIERFGYPQHEAVGVYQGSSSSVWSYWWTRMIVGASPPEDRTDVEVTLGAAAGFASGGRPIRVPILRFIFSGDRLVGMEKF